VVAGIGGGDSGIRGFLAAYDPATGQPKDFVSGYHNASVPNLWDRSRE